MSVEVATKVNWTATRAVSTRLPSLDGMRGLGLLVVVGCHAIGTPGFPVGISGAYPIGYIGAYALRLFFCLSGFLITRQLLQERADTGGLSLRLFYLRRAFRICPAAWAYIATIGVLTWLGIANSNAFDMLAAATYTTNAYLHRTHWMSHYWSLSVEEQFYLLWPVLLSRLSLAAVTRVLIGTLIAAPFVRYAIAYFTPPTYIYGVWFPMNVDGLACGCLLAIVGERLWAWPAYRRFLTSRWLPWLTAVPPLLSLFHDRPRTYNLVLVTIISVGSAITVDFYLRFPERGAGPLLNWKPICVLGTFSYSGYIWQQLFVNRYSGLPITVFPFSAVATFAVAILSYHLIERPFHRYGRTRFRDPVVFLKGH